MYAVYKWHRSAEDISIRTNGANRKASLTNGDFFTNGSIGEGFLTIGICLCILDMYDKDVPIQYSAIMDFFDRNVVHK